MEVSKKMVRPKSLVLGLAVAVIFSLAASGQVFQGCLKCGVDETTLDYLTPVERLRIPESLAAEIRAIDVSLGLIFGSHVPQGRFNGLGDFLDLTEDGPRKGRFAFSGYAELGTNHAIFNIELVDHPKWYRLSGEIRNDDGPSVLILEPPGKAEPTVHTLGLATTP